MTLQTLGFDIRFCLKKRLWFFSLICLAFLFLMPIRAGLEFQYYTGIISDPDTALALANGLKQMFGAGDEYTIFIMLVMSLAAGLIFTTDMHKRRQVDFYFSLPINRTHLFSVNYFTGAICVIVPYIAFLLLSMAVLLLMGFGAHIPFGTVFAGMGINILFFLLSYSTVILAGIICGNLVVSGIMALLLQAVGPVLLVLYTTGRELFQPTWHQALPMEDIIIYSSPAARYISTWKYDFYLPLWELLLILAVTAGIFFLALLLFRRRPAEAAGKALIFPKSKPFIKYPITVMAAFGMALMFYYLGRENWPWFFFGMLLGGFIAAQTMEIVYHGDFRAIIKKLPQLGITLAITAICCTVLITDIIGFNKYVPDEDDVVSVEVSFGNVDNYGTISAKDHSSFADKNSPYHQLREQLFADFGNSGKLENKESIAAVISIAKKMVYGIPTEERFFGDYYRYYYDYPSETTMTVRYELKNGGTRTRKYNYDRALYVADIQQELITLQNDAVYRENTLDMFRFDPAYTRIYSITAYNDPNNNYKNSTEGIFLNKDISELLAVYEQELLSMDGDALAAAMPIGYIQFMVFGEDPKIYTSSVKPAEYSRIIYQSDNICFDYPVYDGFTRTIALMDQMGIFESDLWQINTDDIISVTLYQATDGFEQGKEGAEAISSPDGTAIAVDTEPSGRTSYEEVTAEYFMPQDEEKIKELLTSTYSSESFRIGYLHDAVPHLQLLVKYKDPYGGYTEMSRYFMAL